MVSQKDQVIDTSHLVQKEHQFVNRTAISNDSSKTEEEGSQTPQPPRSTLNDELQSLRVKKFSQIPAKKHKVIAEFDFEDED